MTDLFILVPLPVLAGFVMAGILLNLTPGADVIFATASGLAGGPKVGAAAGLGVGLGGLVHVALAIAGVSALLAASPVGFTALRWAGAGYLLLLAWRSWNATGGLGGGKGAARPMRALARGFMTNVLNPKVALFILAFLPQFADPERGPVWEQMLILGLAFVVTGTFITAGYGALAGMLGHRLTARSRLLNRISSVMFAGLAVRLVLD